MLEMQKSDFLIKLYPEYPVFSREVLDLLWSLMRKHLSDWSASLRVALDEDEEDFEDASEGRIFEAVEAISPKHRGFGSIVVGGSYEELMFFLSTSDSSLPPDSNAIGIEIFDAASINGLPCSEWIEGFVKEFVSETPVRYGRAHLSEEFDSKNLVESDTSLRAMGVNISNSIPGIYWLNYFGKPYKSLFTSGDVSSVALHEVREDQKGLLLILDKDPQNWQAESYKNMENSIIRSLGRDYFFLREEPEHTSLAPDFNPAR